jgi:hypothetical protein
MTSDNFIYFTLEILAVFMGAKLKNYRIFAPVFNSMQKLTSDKFTKTEKLIILLSLLLLIPALFINLRFFTPFSR